MGYAEPKWVSARSMGEHAGMERAIGICGSGGVADARGLIKPV